MVITFCVSEAMEGVTQGGWRSWLRWRGASQVRKPARLNKEAAMQRTQYVQPPQPIKNRQDAAAANKRFSSHTKSKKPARLNAHDQQTKPTARVKKYDMHKGSTGHVRTTKWKQFNPWTTKKNHKPHQTTDHSPSRN